MAVVAGIDEAGFGPILGPLVVSATVFQIPDQVAHHSLWDLLASAVSRKPVKRHPGLAIGDSKKLYSPSQGIACLERGVLGALMAVTPNQQSLRGLLASLCPAVLPEMDEYPWYRGADLPLPHGCDATDLRLRANGLRAAMASARVNLAGARSEVVLEGRYNRLVQASNNKASTLLDHTCRLIDWVWRSHSQEPLVRIDVDRQGGRAHYLPTLQRLFEGGSFRILVEQPEHSGYRVTLAGRTLEVHFLERGEDCHMGIALASMTSKYLRELFMELLNRYWAQHVPDLKPTAGYYTDGKRFLQDIEAACRQMDTPMGLLVRSR